MQRILKFAEDSPFVESFSVTDFRNGSRIYMREYLSTSERYYSNHWQLSEELCVRWDNAPHHTALENYPHHLHIGERLLPSHCTDPFQIITWIETLFRRQLVMNPDNLVQNLDELRPSNK